MRPAEYWGARNRRYGEAASYDIHDRLGLKNRYLRVVRDRAVLAALSEVAPGGRVLDLGCGTGSLSRCLVSQRLRVVGLDIAGELLQHARRQQLAPGASFVLYGGESIPLRTGSVDACVTYLVLGHVTEAQVLERLLGEVERVLRPNGVLAAIEQTSRRQRRSRDQMKVQRTAGEYLAHLCQTGFSEVTARTVRRGHFPLTYAIRLGLVPGRALSRLATLESWLGRHLPAPCFDYAETLLVARRR